MSVAKTTEIISSSTVSFDDAMKQGIARANQTLNLDFAPLGKGAAREHCASAPPRVMSISAAKAASRAHRPLTPKIEFG